MNTLLILALLFQTSGSFQENRLKVRHEHTVGSCEGTLTFSEKEIRYETREKDHQRTWSYSDVKFFEIVSSHELELHTYEDHGVLRLGQDRKLVFRLLDGQIDGELYKMLAEKSPRQVVTHIIFSSAEVIQSIPAKHKHRLGGCQGAVVIGQERILYRADRPEDSRIWRLKDIDTFASNDPFHLRITTAFETFNFELKTPLEPSSYDHIWTAVYSPDVQSYLRKNGAKNRNQP